MGTEFFVKFDLKEIPLAKYYDYGFGMYPELVPLYIEEKLERKLSELAEERISAYEPMAQEIEIVDLEEALHEQSEKSY